MLRLRIAGGIDRTAPWDVPVDLFFYRDPEELLKQAEKEAAAAPAAEAIFEAATYETPAEDYGSAPQGFSGVDQVDGSYAAPDAAAGWTAQGTVQWQPAAAAPTYA